MKQKRYAGYIIGALLVAIGGLIIINYNSLVKREEQVTNKWQEAQSTYQRRLDLIPNLVQVVKGLSDFEQGTLENIANARAKAATITLRANPESAGSIDEVNASQDELAIAANRIIISIEKYPNLKGTKAYSGLQTQLEGTERRIKFARNDFNKAVADYNIGVRKFPTNLIAKIFGFGVRAGFVADAGTDKAVEIKF